MPCPGGRRDRHSVRLSRGCHHVILRPAIPLSGPTPTHTHPSRAGSHPCSPGLCPRLRQGRCGVRDVRPRRHQCHHRTERRHRRLDSAGGHHGSGRCHIARHRRVPGDRRGGHHAAYHQVGLSDTLGLRDTVGRGEGILYSLDRASRARGARLHQRRPARHARVGLQAHQLYPLVQSRP